MVVVTSKAEIVSESIHTLLFIQIVTVGTYYIFIELHIREQVHIHKVTIIGRRHIIISVQTPHLAQRLTHHQRRPPTQPQKLYPTRRMKEEKEWNKESKNSKQSDSKEKVKRRIDPKRSDEGNADDIPKLVEQ